MMILYVIMIIKAGKLDFIGEYNSISINVKEL